MDAYVEISGILVQTLIFVFGGVAMVIRHDVTTKTLKEDIAAMQQELKSLSQVITAQAVQDQRLLEQSRRMTMLEEKLEGLRRGDGWIQNRNPRSSGDGTVDREY